MVNEMFLEETYKEVDRSMDNVVDIDYAPEALYKALKGFKGMKSHEQ
jgi:hypothetical protein